mgnify:CR=1 FL=1
MDLYIQIVVVACLTGMTSLLAHRSAAVFHDGIRPILPQLIEGYMNRREAGSIAFGLSIGFVASVGISFTLKTGLLNAWLLFLPTDILGVLAMNSLLAGHHKAPPHRQHHLAAPTRSRGQHVKPALDYVLPVKRNFAVCAVFQVNGIHREHPEYAILAWVRLSHSRRDPT